MKKIITQLKEFISSYSIIVWLLFLIFNAVSIYIYYYKDGDEFFNKLEGAKTIYWETLLFSFHYFFVFFLIYFLSKKENKPKINWGAIFLLIIRFALFSARDYYNFHLKLLPYFKSEENLYIYTKILNELFRMIYLFVPFLVIWYFKDKNNQAFYGFDSTHHQTKLYWILLACMIPLLIYAGTQKDFLDYYPRGQKIINYGGTQFQFIVYELVYGIDFISIEMYFRGFLILAFSQWFGKHTILPMVCFYMSIHFGKPMGETISSIFGGMILGVISYHSKSIYGGVMVHAGIAWLMELSGWIGNLLRS